MADSLIFLRSKRVSARMRSLASLTQPWLVIAFGIALGYLATFWYFLSEPGTVRIFLLSDAWNQPSNQVFLDNNSVYYRLKLCGCPLPQSMSVTLPRLIIHMGRDEW